MNIMEKNNNNKKNMNTKMLQPGQIAKGRCNYRKMVAIDVPGVSATETGKRTCLYTYENQMTIEIRNVIFFMGDSSWLLSIFRLLALAMLALLNFFHLDN